MNGTHEHDSEFDGQAGKDDLDWREPGPSGEID